MDIVVSLDRTSTIPLYQQLAEQLRHAVHQGRLKPNQKLPSSRLLANSLEISRATVTQSYDQLLSEGYFETRHGSGTYVYPQLSDDCLKATFTFSESFNFPDIGILSRFGNDLLTLKQIEVPEPEEGIGFRFGSPAADRFPMELWRRLLSRHCKNMPELLNYATDASGHLPLKVAIADYLGRSRGVRCQPDQVMIVNGSQQALDLITRITIDPNDWVAVEDPGYLGARHCFRSQGANLQPVPVDSEGLDVEVLNTYRQSFKLLYVTPSHQFPTGALLSLSRRLALLQWAQKTGTIILEDDYDSEYRYGDRPIPALQGLDNYNSVVYVGTFSKILFPSLRIGYLVVPPAWVSILKRAKWLCDRCSPLLEQYALTDFINEGHFVRHIRRMRQLYDRRRQVLVNALAYYLGSQVKVLGENAGIHLMVKIDTILSDEVVIERASLAGVGLISAKGYYLGNPKSGEFLFGYSQLDEAQIEEGIKKLYEVLKD